MPAWPGPALQTRLQAQARSSCQLDACIEEAPNSHKPDDDRNQPLNCDASLGLHRTARSSVSCCMLTLLRPVWSAPSLVQTSVIMSCLESGAAVSRKAVHHWHAGKGWWLQSTPCQSPCRMPGSASSAPGTAGTCSCWAAPRTTSCTMAACHSTAIQQRSTQSRAQRRPHGLL